MQFVAFTHHEILFVPFGNEKLLIDNQSELNYSIELTQSQDYFLIINRFELLPLVFIPFKSFVSILIP